jgi:hypothetical protein
LKRRNTEKEELYSKEMKYRQTRSRENSQTNKRQTNIQKERQKLRTAKWNIHFCCAFQEDENTPKKQNV